MVRKANKMTTKTNSIHMQRRDFLKVLGVGTASVAVLSATAVPVREWFLSSFLTVQTTFGNSLLRGTLDGRIFQSLDDGHTWERVFFFGSHCTVDNLLTQNEQVFARISVEGIPFWIYSTDAKTWRTVD
jgi:hypothetical protein